MVDREEFYEFLVELINRAVDYGLQSSPTEKKLAYRHFVEASAAGAYDLPTIPEWVRKHLSSWLKVSELRTMYWNYMKEGPPKRLPNTERLFIYDWEHENLVDLYGGHSGLESYLRERDAQDYKALALALKELATAHWEKFQVKRRGVRRRIGDERVSHVRRKEAAIYLQCSKKQIDRLCENGGPLEKTETGMITNASLRRAHGRSKQ